MIRTRDIFKQRGDWTKFSWKKTQKLSNRVASSGTKMHAPARFFAPAVQLAQFLSCSPWRSFSSFCTDPVFARHVGDHEALLSRVVHTSPVRKCSLRKVEFETFLEWDTNWRPLRAEVTKTHPVSSFNKIQGEMPTTKTEQECYA